MRSVSYNPQEPPHMDVDFKQLIKDGKLEDCRRLLSAAVKRKPADSSLRVFLFQLLAVMGDFGRARTQLDTAAEMDRNCLLLRAMYTPALECEPFRADVYRGVRTPLIFGEPTEWMGLFVQANRLEGEGKAEAAADLRDRAFEAAPAVPGALDGEPFGWIADADPHFGPMLEAVVGGKHYWIPLQRISKIVFEPPTDLRDLVWMTAQFVWANGGESYGLVPVRYPGSESHDESAIRLAKKTEWKDASGRAPCGVGQRLFATDKGETGILQIRAMTLEPPEEELEQGAGKPAAEE